MTQGSQLVLHRLQLYVGPIEALAEVSLVSVLDEYGDFRPVKLVLGLR